MQANQNSTRIGFFTSSEIMALTVQGQIKMTQEELDARPKKGKGSSTNYKEGGLGDKALNYIEEVNFERMLGRSLESDSFAKPLIWGKLMEDRVNLLLGTDWHIKSNESKVHPSFPDCWSGSQDGRHITSVPQASSEIKCPWTLKSFCRLASCMTTWEDVNGIRYSTNEDAAQLLRKAYDDKTGEKFYWQVVSNADIHGLDYGELIFYVPRQEELPEIREYAQQYDKGEIPLFALYFIGSNTNDDEFPYLLRSGIYNNLNVIRFRIPEEDKLFLRSKVEEASTYLVKV